MTTAVEHQHGVREEGLPADEPAAVIGADISADIDNDIDNDRPDSLTEREVDSTVVVHRVVSAILVNPAGEVLLQQRDDRADLRYPGFWTLFGGSAESEEPPDAAIRRELWEELELELSLTFWKQYRCPARTIPGSLLTINHVFIGRLLRDIATISLHEGQAMRFFSRAEASTLVLAFEQSPVLLEFFTFQERLTGALHRGSRLDR